jgi:hypothetical protein
LRRRFASGAVQQFLVALVDGLYLGADLLFHVPRRLLQLLHPGGRAGNIVILATEQSDSHQDYKDYEQQLCHGVYLSKDRVGAA